MCGILRLGGRGTSAHHKFGLSQAMVYPQKYGDNQTRLFIHWTRDGYYRTGCLDHDCLGFVQVNNRYSLGGTLTPVSKYDGQQFDIEISIQQDKTTGNWWLILQDIPIGYWPAQLFTRFAFGADRIRWGGQIYDSEGNGEHTTTTMGSGHFPYEGPRRASYFSKLRYLDDSNDLRDPMIASLQPEVTNKFCYNAMISQDSNHGVYFYYGGPGYNAECP
ncbi:Active breakpoint cluster region-related protein [Bienertia sinuspersici]